MQAKNCPFRPKKEYKVQKIRLLEKTIHNNQESLVSQLGDF